MLSPGKDDAGSLSGTGNKEASSWKRKQKELNS